MSEFVPNLVLDEYAFLMEVELGGWSKFSRGFQGRDVEGNYYVLELMSKKRRGIDALLKLRQKTILNCLDIKQTKDGKWIQIYEYFPGETLRDLMETGEGFSLLDIAIICIQICNGLMAIHELNLIHEDLRPENILINSQGEVKLKGILISELMVNYVNLPEMWNYVAPEQISKSVWVNPGPASNAFSLGSIMYEILTGKKYGKSIELRRIAFWDSEKEKIYEFITNNQEISPDTVADIYKHRWQIETMFKRLKQNFPLKYFLGDSQNAIEIQIWTALIIQLLMLVVQRKIKRKWAYSNMVSVVRFHLMTYINLFKFLENPDKKWADLTTKTNEIQLSLFT